MKTWIFLTNPFLTAANRTFSKALKISTYHDAQLQAHTSDPFFAGLYAVYHPFHLAVAGAYSSWKSQGGTQKGSTLTVNQLLDLMTKSKLSDWEYAILGVYKKSTPGFVALFPNGRYPFNSGTIESRVAAVKQLGISLNGITTLATIKAEVDDFYAQLSADRTTQLGHFGNTENKSDALEAAITTAMIEMFANYGLMINHFKANPVLAEPFFDLDTIRNHDQIIFLKTVPSSSKKNILKHTFSPTDEIKITNNGTMSLDLYLSSNADGDPVNNKVTLEPNTSETFTITDLGTLDNTFLNVSNPNATEGHCKVELL